MGFHDHFSADSAGYARHRPGYDPALGAWLASLAPDTALAVDVATGNGQAARILAPHFRRVFACDASAAQIAAARAPDNVRFAVSAAESLPLADGVAGLLTVAQALHWFDLPRFYAEAHRVLAPRGAIAAWTYNLLRVEPRVDAVIHALYHEGLRGWWPAARRHVEDGYATLPFPFARIEAPRFTLEARMDADALLGYLATWSAVTACREATGADPLARVEPDLRAAFGPGERAVRWPLHLLVGRR